MKRDLSSALGAMFRPKTVAVVGASSRTDSVGRTLMDNLRKSGEHALFAVNPRHARLFGKTCYPSVSDIPEKIDLAVIATPAAVVPEVIRDGVTAGVASAVILSAGFRETGEAGRVLEDQVLKEARGKLPILGPNCLGLMRPHAGLNATFADEMAKPGRLGFISQSGALCTSILDWSLRENVGFSAFVSIGSMLDIGWGDLIRYLGEDKETESLLLYMESIGDAESFLSAAREVALKKPIIVLKAGRTEAAAHAAVSHTGALTGSDAVLDAAFRRVGVLPMVERDGYEVILGANVDPQFGPVILFGTGGTLVEVYKDNALGLPPLNTTLAKRMMERTKIYKAMSGARGRKSVDVEKLSELIVQFSRLVMNERRIREIEINPLLASSWGLLALDARVVLHAS